MHLEPASVVSTQSRRPAMGDMEEVSVGETKRSEKLGLALAGVGEESPALMRIWPDWKAVGGEGRATTTAGIMGS